MITSFLRFYFSPTLANWRTLRRACMARLPKPKATAANARAA